MPPRLAVRPRCTRCDLQKIRQVFGTTIIRFSAGIQKRHGLIAQNLFPDLPTSVSMSPEEKRDNNAEAIPARAAAPESEVPGNGASEGDVEAASHKHTPHWKADEVQEIPYKSVLDRLVTVVS